MQLFTVSEFKKKYTDYENITIADYQIETACEMIYSQVGLIYRQEWDAESVPEPVKNACMEQLRFILEHDIPAVDATHIKAGEMDANLSSDYSTYAIRILANNGYLYRGSPLTSNMSLNMEF